jgi:hypothetical protein
MPYNPQAYSSAHVGASGVTLPPGPLSGFHNSAQQQFQQLYPWLGTVAGVNSVTTPSQPGITSESLDNVSPNADDTTRKVEEVPSGGTVVSTRTSNLVSCPNADGEVSLGCWLLSSDNDRFARKNLETDTMPGEKEPRDIMVVPGNWMDLQNDPASQTYTNVTADLYNQETLASEQRIFTGLMVNSNTGQMYETYEDDVPPPNTDRARHLPEEFTMQNPKMTSLNGGWDPNLPARNKTEVLEVEYGPDAGRNIWGSGLYASKIRDITEQKDVRQQFNNRDGFVPIEPAWDTRAVGFVGHVSAYRGTPYMPPTQREATIKPITFNDTVTNVQNIDFDRPADRTNPVHNGDARQGNREHLAMFQGGTMSMANQAPGRINYSAVDIHQTPRVPETLLVFDPTVNAGQIYIDGNVVLKEEQRYSKYLAGADAHAIKVTPVTRGQRRNAARQDKSEGNQYSVGQQTSTQGLQQSIDRDFMATVRLITENTEAQGARQSHQQSAIGDGDGFPESRASVRLGTDRSLGSNLASNKRQSMASTIGAADGRLADEMAFLSSVRLITDARDATLTGFRTFDEIETSNRNVAITKLAKERALASRSTGISDGQADGGFVKIMPEFSGKIDRSRSVALADRATVGGALEGERRHESMRAVNRASRFENSPEFDQEFSRITYGAIEQIGMGSTQGPEVTVYKKQFGDSLPRIQPSFIPVW